MAKNRTLSGSALVLWLIVMAQRLIRLFYHVKPLRNDGNIIICTKLKRYNARPITLDDGSEIKTGDKIIELHLNNAWFVKRRKRSTAPALIWEGLRCFEQDLSILSGQIADGVFGSVAALHGHTLLHRLAIRLGFQVEEMPNTLWKKIAGFYIAGLMQNYYLGGKGEFKASSGKPLELKSAWLSKTALFRLYGGVHADYPGTLTT